MSEIGKTFVIFGFMLIIVGILLMLFPKFLFRLPGDIHIEGENYSIYIPITSSILLSILLTLVLNLIVWIFNR